MNIAKIIFCISAIVIYSGCDSYKDGFDRGRKLARYTATLSDLETWAISFEMYCKKYNKYPNSNSIEDLRNLFREFNDENLSIDDRWDAKYLVNSTETEYIISSKGEDNKGSHEYGNAIEEEDFSRSITFKNGEFVQYLKIYSKFVKEIEQTTGSITESTP